MAHVDVYGRTDALEIPVLGAIANRLEARRENQQYMGMLREYLDLLPLADAENVLVLGCGTGVEVRELITRDYFSGQVTAVDLSAELIEFGRSSFASDGVGADVKWIAADAASTGLKDSGYDLIIAHTLISHVPSPKLILQEIERLVTSNGLVAIFDGDYATMTFGTDDPEYGKKMDEKLIRGLIANPRIMRSLPRMLSNYGLTLLDSRGWVLSEIGKADFFLGSLDSLPILLPSAGVATKQEIEEFVDDQRRASDAGTFFAGYNFYAMIAKAR